MAELPTTLARVLASREPGLPSAARTGKQRIEGIDYVPLRRGEPGFAPPIRRGSKITLGGAHRPPGARPSRKPTLEELEARWDAIDADWRRWIEEQRARGRSDSELAEQSKRFAFSFARNLHAELEARRAKRSKPKRAESPARVRRRPRTRGHADLIRLRRHELEEMGTDAARAEIERRRVKRQARRKARAAA